MLIRGKFDRNSGLNQEKIREIALKLDAKLGAEIDDEKLSCYVYVLQCETPNHYYVGVTTNIDKRMAQHVKVANSRSKKYVEPSSYWFVNTHGVETAILCYPVQSMNRALNLEVMLARYLSQNGFVTNCGVYSEETAYGRVFYNKATGEKLSEELQGIWRNRS